VVVVVTSLVVFGGLVGRYACMHWGLSGKGSLLLLLLLLVATTTTRCYNNNYYYYYYYYYYPEVAVAYDVRKYLLLLRLLFATLMT